MGECRTGPWVEQVGCLLISPQTATDFMIAIFSASLAAGVAVVVLRSQFKHDRKLAFEQLKTDQAIARAAARRPLVEQLANGLVEVAMLRRGSTGEVDDGEVGVAILDSRRNPKVEDLRRTLQRCEPYLSSTDGAQLWALSSDVEMRWAVCHEAARSIIPREFTVAALAPDAAESRAIGVASGILLSDAEKRSGLVGAALLSWDGIEELDLSSVLDAVPAPSPNAKDRQQAQREWKQAFYRDMAEAAPARDLPDDIRRQLARLAALDE